MTLEEAIEHAEKEVVKLEQKCEESCAEDHRQLVSWLKELQQYHTIGTLEECQAAIKNKELVTSLQG